MLSPLRRFVPLFASLVLGVCFPRTAEAAIPDGVSDAVIEVLGPVVAEELGDDEWAALLEACPQEHVEGFVPCVEANEEITELVLGATQRVTDGLTEAFGEDVVAAHGEQLLALSGEQLQAVAEACGDVEDFAGCVTEALTKSDEPAGEGDEPAGEGDELDAHEEEGGSSYPPEALALLPAEVLDELPKALTNFLRPEDYAALHEACPQEDLEQAIECLSTPKLEELLDTLHTRGVVAALLGYMDQELPNRMSPEQLDALAEGCTEPGGIWAECVFTKGVDDEQCSDPEDVLADCLVDDDVVTQAYMVIQQDKKAAFGAELFVEFRGLMAILTMADIEALRTRCPQADQEALYECLSADEQIDEIIGVFAEAAVEIVDEAQAELTAAGNPLDDEQSERYAEAFTNLLLTFPPRAIASLATTCEAKHPELETLQDPASLDTILACIEEEASTDHVANPAFISAERLRKWLEIARQKVTDAVRQKEAEAQARSSQYILTILGMVAVVGFFVVLLLPLRARQQNPAAGAQLWKASAVAAGTFVLTIMLLGATLLVMRTVQGQVATESTSPKMVIANGVFDVLERDEFVEELSDMSRVRLDFIKTPLRRIVEGGADVTPEEAERHLAVAAYLSEHWVEQLEEPELRPLVKNAQMLKSHVASFKRTFAFYRKVDWLMGYVPIVLALLAVIVYMLPLRETLVAIATAPLRAAEGGDAGTFRRAMGMVGAELKLLPFFLTAMVAFLLVTGVFLSLAVEPLIENLLNFSLMTVFYILVTEASSFVLYASLGGAILLLVACIAVYIVAMVFFMGSVRKILRARFHWGQAIGRYKSFWIYGVPATLAVMLFPMVYSLLVQWVAIEHVLPAIDLDNGTITPFDMLLVPFGGLLLMFPLLWAVRGFRALGYVKKYPVVRDQPPKG